MFKFDRSWNTYDELRHNYSEIVDPKYSSACQRCPRDIILWADIVFVKRMTTDQRLSFTRGGTIAWSWEISDMHRTPSVLDHEIRWWWFFQQLCDCSQTWKGARRGHYLHDDRERHPHGYCPAYTNKTYEYCGLTYSISIVRIDIKKTHLDHCGDKKRWKS